MAIARQKVFPRRIKTEEQARDSIITLIDIAFQKAVSQPYEPKYIRVQFERFAQDGTDLFSSYVLDPIIQHYQAVGWIFEQPGVVTISLEGGQNDKIVLIFV